jgi:hypothetical protein
MCVVRVREPPPVTTRDRGTTERIQQLAISSKIIRKPSSATKYIHKHTN